MTKEDYVNAYLDYRNNYLTLKGYADYNNLSFEVAGTIINLGEYLYERRLPISRGDKL